MKQEFLTIGHYKEPLRKVENGFGYLGALLQTVDGEKVQCHICGNLFSRLGLHILNKHGITTQEYKETFQLARTTALASDKSRDNAKMNTIVWRNNLTVAERKEHHRKRMEGKRRWLEEHKNDDSQIRLETKNKRGTCPDQLLEEVKECYKNIGHIPSKRDFVAYCESERYVFLLQKTFGSWSHALTMAGFEPQKQSYSPRPKHSDEELLEYLSIFYQENGTPPTHSDCCRGLVPSANVYKKRFGSLPRARVLAGIPEPSGRWGGAWINFVHNMDDIKFQAPAILNSISYTKDGGVRLGFVTNELSDEDKLIVARFFQKFGFIMFKSNEFAVTDIPTEQAEDTSKTPSKRLRAVLFALWKQTGAQGDFETWYRGEMEKLITKVKNNLD